MPSLLTPYESERLHKDSSEDRLTSRFFGHLSNMGSGMRSKIFHNLGVNVDAEVTITLWESFETTEIGRREVDAMIRSNNVVIVVEDKLGSEFDVQQLVDEFQITSQVIDNKDVSLLCISHHLSKPKEIDLAEMQIGRPIKWVSWLQCLRFLRELDQQFMDPKTKQNVGDLIVYMESIGLDANQGFLEDDDWKDFIRMLESSEELLDERSAGKAIKDGGFNWETPDPRHRLHRHSSDKNAYWGRWFWKEVSKKDFGYWVAVGVINDNVQIECATYHKSSEPIAKVTPEYGVTEVGKREGWDGDYRKYSRYLPVKTLHSKLLYEQLEEINSFIKSCVNETKGIFG